MAAKQTDIKQRLGARIREFREQRGMSQEECAQACRVSRVYLGSLERGDQAATIEVLDRIARGLDVGIVDLLGDVAGPRANSGRTGLPRNRAFAERLAAYAADASDDDLRRFERLARAFFGLSVSRSSEDGRPKVRRTGFERKKPQRRGE
ncbi:MAG: helix-turn-helix transcriptional regulator [Planctomycetes bacterium]|nr:helix-turn-helix transcriptional regulator [Planctomycetota bacterium]MCW8138450.1 helix-turn-helix transcriptional regulator [Planctomycetota bacterium]